MMRLIIGALVLALTAPTFADDASHEFATGADQTAVLEYRSFGRRFGLQGLLAERLEVESNKDRVNYKGKPAAGGAAWYRLNDRFALGLTANLDEDVKGYGIGAKIYFGK